MWIKTTFLFQSVLIVVVAKCSNIDVFEPIMRPSPESNVTKEDLFGYSIVLHQLNLTGGLRDVQ